MFYLSFINNDNFSNDGIYGHASDDEGVVAENSIQYFQALQREKVPASLHIFATGGHGFGAAKHYNDPVSSWLDQSLQWMTWQGF